MNWIRDNILKIVLLIFAVIVIVVVIVACSGTGVGNEDRSYGYVALENKLQSAAISYVKEHPSILPKTTDTVKKVKSDTLIEAGKMNKMYSPENKSVACKGYVQIEKVSEDTKSYRYTPYISCGNYYITKSIGSYIIDKETENGEFTRTADDGLYEVGGEYVFRGEHPNNFIIIGSHIYRVIKIDAEGMLELISITKTQDGYAWDDRYNITKDANVGINDFEKSRMYEGLEFIYKNKDEDQGEVYFTDEERAYIQEHDFCIGKRDINDTNIYSGVECSVTMPLKVGLISVNEFARTSLDVNCKGVFDKSCANYNYFSKLGTKYDSSIATLTAASNNSYNFYKYAYGEMKTRVTDLISEVYPVIFISDKVIYKSGTGTLTDPYIVR